MFPRVTHPSATKPEGFVRLACVRPAASVHSEPGSNSQVESTEMLSLTSNLCTSAAQLRTDLILCSVLQLKNNKSRKTVKLVTLIIGPSALAKFPKEPICVGTKRRNAQTAHISLQISSMSKSRRQKQMTALNLSATSRRIFEYSFRTLPSSAPPRSDRFRPSSFR